MRLHHLAIALILVGCQTKTGSKQLGVGAASGAGATDIGCDEGTAVALDVLGDNVVSITATDIVLVLDESGSIDRSEFDQLQDFAVALVNSLHTAGLFDNGGSVGLVMFANNARTVLSLSGNRNQVVNAIRSVQQRRGATCIGCGINTATDMLEAQSAAGNKRLAIVVTDGTNNRPANDTLTPEDEPAEHLAAAITASDTAAVERFAIGVGNGIDQTELANVGTDPDDQHVFLANDFASINLVLSNLVAAVVTPGSTNVVVTATVSAHFAASSPSVTHGSVTQTGNQLVWTIDALGEEVATLEYTATHDPDYAGGVESVNDSVTFTDDEGNMVSFPDIALNVHGCPAAIALSPASATLPVGTTADLTASVSDDFGDPVSGVAVAFDVTAGPNSGAGDSDSTDSGGEAEGSYTSNGTLGVDTVVASFSRGADVVESPGSSIAWADVTPPNLECVPSVNQPPHAGGSTPPPNGKNGFFMLLVSDDIDPNPEVTIGGFGTFFDRDIIKLTIAPGLQHPIRTNIGGAAVAHMLFSDDPVVTATDAAGNTTTTTCEFAP